MIAAHRRVLATLGTAVVILGASRSLRLSLLPLWADHVGLSASTTSLIFAGAAALDVAFMWPGGWLMDTRGRMVVAVPVVLSMAVACLLLPLATDAVSVALVMALIAMRQRPRVGHRDDPGRGRRTRRRAGRSSSARGGCAATSATRAGRCWSARWPPSHRWRWRA